MTKPDDTVCDEEVFAEVVNSNIRPLINYVYYRGAELNEAEDMVQDAFVKLWMNCGKVPFKSAVPFMVRVLRNMMSNHYDHKKVVLKFASRPQNYESVETPEFLLEKKEFQEKLNAAISNLPPGQREVFLMNRIDKKTYVQIAEELNISKKAVEKRMHKALVKLRQLTKRI